MKLSVIIIILVLGLKLGYSQMIDEDTPENALPSNSLIAVEWELDFSDEFNGSAVNTTRWRIDSSTKSRAARPNIGINDWRWKPSNVLVEDGNLVLKVYKTGTNSMTNGSINSYNKYMTTYGYFEARILVGEAHKGTHTAFWLQGPNMSNVDGTANDGAEIDIFETAWTGDYTKSVVHIDGYGADHQANTKQYNTPGIHSGFHTWGFHWTENFMDIYYDGVFKVRYSNSKWVVRSPEFLWLSNGASFGLNGDQYFLDLPEGYLTETQVDYIRVWKHDGEGETNDSLLIQDQWDLLYTDSEDTHADNLAINAFDGNPYTFWHTEWYENMPDHPHELQIDLGDTASIYGFRYLPRQDQNPNGNIVQYQFFTSMDGANWGDAVTSGSFPENQSRKFIFFNDTIKCKYVRFISLSAIDDLKFANVAEIELYGSYSGLGTGTSGMLSEMKYRTNIEVFPNPFQNNIHLKISDKNSYLDWRIFTIEGTLLKEGRFSNLSENLTINADDLISGSYILEINCSGRKDVKLLFKD